MPRGENTDSQRASALGPKPKPATSPMRIMARLLAERKTLFFSNLGLRLLKDLLPFLGPILIGITVDLLSGASGSDRSLFGIQLTQSDVRSIVIVAVAMALLAIAKAVVGYVHTIVAAHVGRHVVQAARRDLANAAMQMSLDERRRFNSGDLLDRCLADSKGLRGFTQNVIIRVISNTVRAVFPLVFMFTIDPLLAVVVLAVIPLQSSVSALLQRRLQRQTREARSREAVHTSAVKEAIDGWNNVASVGGQGWAAQGIHETAAASEDAKIVKKHTTASISAVISLCTAFGIAAVYAIGGWRIISSGVLDGTATEGALTLGTLTAFVGVAKKTYAPFQAYTKIVSSYRTGLVNLERVAEVLDAPMIDPRLDGPTLHVGLGEIRLDNVSFAYNQGDAPTLRGITGAIPGRALTVITGSSGAGKTTLLRLLLGLDVPDTGIVSIDGQDINKARFATVQDAIALVPQEPVLFTGTMGENLLLGLEGVTTQQLTEACDRSGLIETVRGLPKGLDTEVGSGRHMLSGGQLRRMAIARALLRQPGILLLDEPTTGLDEKNSRLVLNTLRRISDRTTVVMVSHRSEPLKASDHHLVLRDGGWSSSSDHQSADGVTVTATAATAVSAEADQNGAAETAVTSAGVHRQLDRKILARTAMGRPVVFNGIDSDAAASRAMLISGHRSLAEPMTNVGPAVFSQLLAEGDPLIALAAIEDVNPDGVFSSRRETVSGVDVSQDHRSRVAKETRLLHDALATWSTTVLIDVAQEAFPTDDDHDVHIVVRFRPDAAKRPAAETAAFASRIRQRVDQTRFSYRVTLVGCQPGTAAAELDLPVVELTARAAGGRDVQLAMIAATVATCRAAVESSQMAPA